MKNLNMLFDGIKSTNELINSIAYESSVNSFNIGKDKYNLVIGNYFGARGGAYCIVSKGELKQGVIYSDYIKKPIESYFFNRGLGIKDTDSVKAVNEFIEFTNRQYGLSTHRTMSTKGVGAEIKYVFTISNDINNCGSILMHGLTASSISKEESGTLMSEVIDYICLTFDCSMVVFTDSHEAGDLHLALKSIVDGKNERGMKLSITDSTKNPNSGNMIFSGVLMHPNVDLDFEDWVDDDYNEYEYDDEY